MVVIVVVAEVVWVVLASLPYPTVSERMVDMPFTFITSPELPTM